MGAFHFTPLAMATVLLAGLISRALLVGSSIPSSFEDWSIYAPVASFCDLYGLYGALFEHKPSVLPLGCGCLFILYRQAKWPSLLGYLSIDVTLCYSSLFVLLNCSFSRERGRAMGELLFSPWIPQAF